VRCPCGVLFERYVTAADPEVDLVDGRLPGPRESEA